MLAASIAADTAHRVLLRRRRDDQLVAADYDQGEWAASLRERRWQSASSLRNYLIPDRRDSIVVLHEGRLCRAAVADYYQYRLAKLVDIMSAHDGGAVELVELGCGAGRNLFSLSLGGRWKRLLGFDKSTVGLQVARSVAERFGIQGIEFGSIDLLSDEVVEHPALRDATIFTYLCLEQLPGQAEAVLGRLARAGVRRGIHVEPSLELFRPTSLRDLATISYVRRQDYEAQVITGARRLEREGLIRIERVERLGYAPTLRNEPTLLVWSRA